MMVKKIVRVSAAVLAVTTLAFMTGCSQIYKTGANIALGFTENHLIMPQFQLGDTTMACESGEALTPLIWGITGVKADADELLVLLFSAAGQCSEARALEHEFRYLRASRANLIDEAQDARIMQKREAEMAARRQYSAYKHMESYFEGRKKAPIGVKCPKFKRDLDEIVYLLGLISGLQAMTNDIAAQQVVGVPRDIAAKVERAMECLNNDKWWGAPRATRAVIWTLLPGAGDGKGDPWETLKQSMRIGERAGVRLPHAMYAMAAQAKGDEKLLRDAVKSFADSQETASNPNYRMFDSMARQIVQNVSDKYWTEKTGSRTPPGSLGKFWDDKPSNQDDGVEIDDLL